MDILSGNLYFISNAFFEKVNDPFLKINYQETKRPHYFALYDKKTKLFWMVPCSSKVAKYRGIIQKKKERHSQRIQMLETFILTQQPQEDSTKNDVERNVAAEYGMGQQL